MPCNQITDSDKQREEWITLCKRIL